MLVSELKQTLEGVNEASITTRFANMAVTEDARALRIDTETHEGIQEFALDEQLERSLSKYLGVSKSYLAKCPPDLKAYNLNHWLNAKPGIEVTAETIDNRVISFHRPGLVLLPIREVADVITDAMHPTDEVVKLERDDTQFHIDIITDHTILIPGRDDIEDRQQGDRQIGDITAAGVRILSSPTEVKAPSVVPYLHRLWCTNGCSAPVDEGLISLRGNTVDEVLHELSEAMTRIRGELDGKLEEYADMVSRRPPGSPSKFARQIGNEYGIPARVMTRVLDRVEILPDDASLYDIQQVFTQTANGAVPYRTMMRLQGLAGDLAMRTDHVVHRCSSCERLLPE